MSNESKEEALELDESLFGSSNGIEEHMKKSKTLMSEDSGIGIVAALSPDDENPYLLSGTYCKMTRSTGIHSGLSEHSKSTKAGTPQPDKFTSAFSQYLALAKRLRDSSLDSSTASSDDECFVEENDNSVEENGGHQKADIVQVISENKENLRKDDIEEPITFHRGLKCNDVESALKILKTRYLLTDINVKHREKSFSVDSTYPALAPKFIDTSVWKPQTFETLMSKTLRDVKEEIELKNRELAGITRLILKRHQDVVDEECKQTEAKKLKQDNTEHSMKDQPLPPTPLKTNTVGLINKSKKKSRNPFGRALSSMRKFVRRDKMARA